MVKLAEIQTSNEIGNRLAPARANRSPRPRSRKDQKDEEAKKDIEKEAAKRKREKKRRIHAPEEANNKKNGSEPPNISVKCRRRVSLFLV